MADDTTWSEKGRSGGRGKRPAKDTPDGNLDDSATSSVVRRPSGDAGAKKVARAAATAGQRDVSLQSRLGFPALVAAICLVGIGVVFYAWSTRDALVRPTQSDHFHAVYGVYDCTLDTEDKYVPPFQSARDQTGIHSHGDGLIHIHPFFELSSGSRAQMTHFFDEMGVDMTPDAITLDNGQVLEAGTECADGSGPAVIKVLHWDFDFEAMADDPPAPTEITENFRDIKFDNDREVYIFAFAAEGTDVPLPPAQRFDQLNNTSPAIAWERTDDAGNLVPNDTGVTVQGETEDGEIIEGSDTPDEDITVDEGSDDDGSDDEGSDDVDG